MTVTLLCCGSGTLLGRTRSGTLLGRYSALLGRTRKVQLQGAAGTHTFRTDTGRCWDTHVQEQSVRTCCFCFFGGGGVLSCARFWLLAPAAAKLLPGVPPAASLSAGSSSYSTSVRGSVSLSAFICLYSFHFCLMAWTAAETHTAERHTML